MDLLLRHMWVVLLIGTVVTGIHQWWRAREKIGEDPARKIELRRFVVGLLAFACLPWAVMGLGIVVGDVDGIQDYVRRGYWTPWVLLWWVVVGVLVAAWLAWLSFFDGGQKLLDHDLLTSDHVSKPWHVKAYAAMGAVGCIVALFFKVGVNPLARLGGGETADGFRTVFVVYAGFWKLVAFALGFAAVGVVALVVALVWLRRQMRQKEPVEPRKKWTPRFMLVWSVGWIVGSAFLVGNVVGSYSQVRVYEEGRAQVSEGVVHVLREQPAEGHGGGDLIEIDGVDLTINRFALTPGYARTIAHGGVLREGARVRVWHFEGEILRVDLQADDVPETEVPAPDGGRSATPVR